MAISASTLSIPRWSNCSRVLGIAAGFALAAKHTVPSNRSDTAFAEWLSTEKSLNRQALKEREEGAPPGVCASMGSVEIGENRMLRQNTTAPRTRPPRPQRYRSGVSELVYCNN